MAFGDLYLAAFRPTDSGFETSIYRYDGSSWSFVVDAPERSSVSVDLAVNPTNGNLVTDTPGRGNRIFEYDGSTWDAGIAVGFELRDLAFDPDGMLYGYGDGTSGVRNRRDDGTWGTFISRFQTDVSGAEGLAINSADEFLLLNDGFGLRFFNRSGTLLRTLRSPPVNRPVLSLTVDTDDTPVAVTQTGVSDIDDYQIRRYNSTTDAWDILPIGFPAGVTRAHAISYDRYFAVDLNPVDWQFRVTAGLTELSPVNWGFALPRLQGQIAFTPVGWEFTVGDVDPQFLDPVHWNITVPDVFGPPITVPLTASLPELMFALAHQVSSLTLDEQLNPQIHFERVPEYLARNVEDFTTIVATYSLESGDELQAFGRRAATAQDVTIQLWSRSSQLLRITDAELFNALSGQDRILSISQPVSRYNPEFGGLFSYSRDLEVMVIV